MGKICKKHLDGVPVTTDISTVTSALSCKRCRMGKVCKKDHNAGKRALIIATHDGNPPATAATPPAKAATARFVSLADRLNPNRPGFDPALRCVWRSQPKAERWEIVAKDARRIALVTGRGSDADGSGALPFLADPDDHCETSPTSFAHLAPLLDALITGFPGAKSKSRACLKIYDPYYCAGGSKMHLGALGFTKVYNEAEDLYAVAEEGRVPVYDVIVTNPPYSDDHISRLLNFVRINGKPCCSLLPDYVCMSKKYRRSLRILDLRNGAAYLSPRKRYDYWTPGGMRAAHTDKNKNAHRNAFLGVRTSPFRSFWHKLPAPVGKIKAVLDTENDGSPNAEAGAQLFLKISDIEAWISGEK